jgi:Phosphopantetheine attachment site.
MEKIVYEILKEITGENLESEGNENLFESGWLDSLGVIQLLLLIEEKTGLYLDPSIVNRKDIETPEKIIQFLQNKKGTLA